LNLTDTHFIFFSKKIIISDIVSLANACDGIYEKENHQS